jgi:hypothetical protein
MNQLNQFTFCDLPNGFALRLLDKMQRFYRDSMHVFDIDPNGRLAQVGPRGNMKGQLGNVDALQLEKWRDFGNCLVQKGAIQVDILNLALAVQEIGIHLFFAKADNELRK